MKRNSRGGTGKGPSKSKSNEPQKGGKTKRAIKNARSLSDVLGAAGKSQGTVAARVRTGPSQGNAPIRRATPDRESERNSADTRPKGPQSKKLTYIMSFQPPEEKAAPPASEKREVRAPQEFARKFDRTVERKDDQEAGEKSDRRFERRPERKADRKSEQRDDQRSKQKFAKDSGRGTAKQPTRESKETRTNRPEQRSARKQESGGNLHARADFRWPQDRVQEEIVVEPTSSSKRRPGARQVQGIVKRHPDGFGFLVADDKETPDVYIARQSMSGIMTNDRVLVEIFQPRSFNKGKDDRLAGEIVQVISRANKRVVGRYLPVDQKYGVLLDDGRGWGADLRIPTKDSMDAQEGEMVAVDIVQYPDHDREFIGRVVSLLGDIDDPINDVLRVVHQAGIPTEFPREALEDARAFGGEVTEEEKTRQGREDIRNLPLITIDGVTARDFDDAVYTEQTHQGFRLIVAIADVSHYVKPGTALDQEAYERGTSTYFPNYVVPMLPEELSNELCSLKPNVDRLCFACEMQLDWQGEVLKFRFFEAVMRSHARVTYGEAQEVIDAKTQGHDRYPEKLEQVKENILLSADLAKILMAKRFREGSLDLEIPETQVVVDATGESADIIRSERLFAHRLIEELMLVTNICTARYLDEAAIPGVFRVHEEPDPDALRNLQRYLWNLGGSRSVMGGSSQTGQMQKKISKALESMSGRPEAQILNILTLRTMQQAHYSGENVGHFGLGFTHYSHFTSPIRRYPDLMAHRLIKSQIYPRYRTMQMSDDEIASATTWLSACEQRSTKAERKVISIKKARFMMKFVGQEFEGIISSVAKFGVFVLLRQYDVDGLVKIENLGNDRFFFDEENLRLIGSRTGRRYVIGDSIKVVVSNVDPEAGKIDFLLPESAQDELDENETEFDSDIDVERGSGVGQRMKERTRGGHKNERKSEKGRGTQQSKKGSKQLGDSGGRKKRRSDENDRRGVRKKRLSKRR